ncbi:MAG TPA: hypothetical protein VGR45_08735 [Stellaceae bacterium]|nr:hypothetical protein [Stellaceae bacterium]
MSRNQTMEDEATPFPWKFAALALLGVALAAVPIIFADPLQFLQTHRTAYFMWEAGFFKVRGMSNRAIVSYEHVLRSSPYDYAAYKAIAPLYLAQDNLISASHAIAMATHLRPHEGQLRGDRAELFVRTIDATGSVPPAPELRKALEDADAAIAAGAGERPRLFRSRLLLYLGDVNGSLDSFRAIDITKLRERNLIGDALAPLTTQYTILAHYLSLYLAGQARHKDVVSVIDEALSVVPPQTFLYDLRGSAYLALGEAKKALADAKSASTLDPNDAAAKTLMAQAKEKIAAAGPGAQADLGKPAK